MPELLDRWPGTVGPAIARHAWPARFARDGTLHVNTSDSVWAFELSQRSQEIAGRLGVAKVRFVPGPLPEQAPATGGRSPEPTADELALAGELAGRIAEEKLRETVQKAISLGLARARSTRPV